MRACVGWYTRYCILPRKGSEPTENIQGFLHHLRALLLGRFQGVGRLVQTLRCSTRKGSEFSSENLVSSPSPSLLPVGLPVRYNKGRWGEKYGTQQGKGLLSPPPSRTDTTIVQQPRYVGYKSGLGQFKGVGRLVQILLRTSARGLGVVAYPSEPFFLAGLKV